MFTAGISQVPFNVSVGVSQGEYEFMNKTKVTNLYDAVVNVAGSVHDLDKHPVGNWYEPKAEKMEELLGAMLLVCTFLRGRVKAQGMFAGATSAPKKENPQIVDFNIPVPLGMACSTLSSQLQLVGVSNESHDFGEERMVLRPRPYLTFLMNHNYTLPLILGGDESDGELLQALRKSAESDDESCGEHEEVSYISRISRWFKIRKDRAPKEKKRIYRTYIDDF